MTQITPILPGLSPLCGKALVARFDGGRMSSDGGVVVLREIEVRLGIATALASCLPDDRAPERVLHGYDEMIRARLFAIACGYEDGDDLDRLRFDPAFKLACGRLPESGADLVSQPSLSRLENLASWRDLARMGLAMIDLFCASFAQVPETIVLDIDETADAAHGQQELAFFNAHYDEYCFQPIHIFEAGSGKPVLSLLRPGKRPSGREAARIIAHVTKRIPRQLAQDPHPMARRQPLCHAASPGNPGGHGLFLCPGLGWQQQTEGPGRTLVRGCRPQAADQRQGQDPALPAERLPSRLLG